ncbi:hypothetical protein ACYSNM_10775 [Myroides sp. LJL116]
MNKIKFTPWVGENYQDGFQSKKVLVLGESHYCNDPSEAVSSITNDIIKDILDPLSAHEPYKNTYTKFAKSMIGSDLDQLKKKQVWDSIAFYNYVQFPISGPRRSPSTQEFEESTSAFFEALELLRPDYVLVWGKRLYDNLPNVGKQGKDIVFQGEEPIETWEYLLSDNKKVKVMSITHPSAGYSWDWWHLRIMEFLQS